MPAFPAGGDGGGGVEAEARRGGEERATATAYADAGHERSGALTLIVFACVWKYWKFMWRR